MLSIFNLVIHPIIRFFAFLERTFINLTRLLRCPLALSIARDHPRTKTELIAENSLLRQQLIILHRQIKKTSFSESVRLCFLLLVSRVQNWKDTLLIPNPDALLRWQRQGFRLFWKFKSRNRGGRPNLSTERVTLIQRIAKENSV